VFLTLDDTGAGNEKQLRATDGDMLDREGHGKIIRGAEDRGFEDSKICRIRGRNGKKVTAKARCTDSGWCNLQCVPPLGPTPEE
jgi:hypothetical protein